MVDQVLLFGIVTLYALADISDVASIPQTSANAMSIATKIVGFVSLMDLALFILTSYDKCEMRDAKCEISLITLSLHSHC